MADQIKHNSKTYNVGGEADLTKVKTGDLLVGFLSGTVREVVFAEGRVVVLKSARTGDLRTPDFDCRGFNLLTEAPEETVQYMAYYGPGYNNALYATELEAREQDNASGFFKITTVGSCYESIVTKVELLPAR